MQINGKEIKFNIMKKSDAKQYEAALKTMERHEQAIKDKMASGQNDLPSVLDEFIDIFREFFTTATGVDIVGDCDDAVEVRAMYEVFLAELAKQKKNFLSVSSLSRIK